MQLNVRDVNFSPEILILVTPSSRLISCPRLKGGGAGKLKINHHRRRGIGDFRSAAIGRICHQFAIESSYIQLQSIIDHHYGGIALDISIQFCKGGIRHKFTMSAALSSTQSQFKVANIQGNKIFSDLEEMLIGNIWELFFLKVVV